MPAHHERPISADLRPELRAEALTGLPGDVVAWACKDSEADPAAVLGTFLTEFGSALGSSPAVEGFGGVARQPGRLFSVIIGDAGLGRKGTAADQVDLLMEAADTDWFTGCRESGVQSAEKLIDLVADSPDGDPRLLMQEYEFSRLVTAMARSSALSSQMRNAWDGKPLRATRRSRKSTVANHAHISLLGFITPAEFARLRRWVRNAGGLESRCLYWMSHQAKVVSPWNLPGLPEALVTRVQDALESSRLYCLERADPITIELCALRGVLPGTAFPVTEEVQTRWDGIRHQLPKVDRSLGSVFDRAETHIVRIALLYALADRASCIQMTHVNAALAVWEYCARSAETLFSIPVGALPPKVDPKRRAQLLQALHDAYPKWTPRTELLSGVFARNVRAKVLDDLLGRTAHSGAAAVPGDPMVHKYVEHRRVRPRGKGRPADEYRWRPSQIGKSFAITEDTK